jgi:hypothetical protein
MARYGTLKRNIRHNIKSWDKAEPTPPHTVRAVAAKAIVVFLALSLAGFLIPLMTNVVFRIPDLYQFDLGRTKLIAETEITIKEEKVADAISSYMRHETDSFQTEGNADGHSALFFTANDSTVMKKLRSFLDNILVIGFTSLALFVALYIMLVKWDRPRELKRGFTGGVVICGFIIAVTAAGILFKGPFMRIWEDVIGAEFMPADRMPELFQSGFFLLAWAVVAFVTLVVILILFSLIHRVAKDEKMF